MEFLLNCLCLLLAVAVDANTMRCSSNLAVLKVLNCWVYAVHSCSIIAVAHCAPYNVVIYRRTMVYCIFTCAPRQYT